MKPDWSDAPYWAEFVALDSDGDWYWYQTKPVLGSECWDPWVHGGRYAPAKTAPVNWKESLEHRP